MQSVRMVLTLRLSIAFASATAIYPFPRTAVSNALVRLPEFLESRRIQPELTRSRDRQPCGVRFVNLSDWNADARITIQLKLSVNMNARSHCNRPRVIGYFDHYIVGDVTATTD